MQSKYEFRIQILMKRKPSGKADVSVKRYLTVAKKYIIPISGRVDLSLLLKR